MLGITLLILAMLSIILLVSDVEHHCLFVLVSALLNITVLVSVMLTINITLSVLLC